MGNWLVALPGIETRYAAKFYTDFEKSVYAGLPSQELDEAWHDLFAPMALRISAEEMETSNQSSVALPEGGFMAWLGVYHELHCIVSGYQCKEKYLITDSGVENAATVELQRALSSRRNRCGEASLRYSRRLVRVPRQGIGSSHA